MSAIIKRKLEDALDISHKLDKNTKPPDVKPSNRYCVILYCIASQSQYDFSEL